jgi:hypothetical protein
LPSTRRKVHWILITGFSEQAWTAEVNQFLCHLHNQIGTKSAKFTQHFQGRSPSNIKNRWYSHLKGMMFQTKKIELSRITSLFVNSQVGEFVSGQRSNVIDPLLTQNIQSF